MVKDKEFKTVPNELGNLPMGRPKAPLASTTWTSKGCVNGQTLERLIYPGSVLDCFGIRT